MVLPHECREAFKWEPRGKRRIHAKPNSGEIGACRRVSTRDCAREARVSSVSAPPRPSSACKTFKVHEAAWGVHRIVARTARHRNRSSSSILRAPDEEARRQEMKRFVADLKRVAAAMAHAIQ